MGSVGKQKICRIWEPFNVIFVDGNMCRFEGFSKELEPPDPEDLGESFRKTIPIGSFYILDLESSSISNNVSSWSRHPDPKYCNTGAGYLYYVGFRFEVAFRQSMRHFISESSCNRADMPTRSK